MYIPSLETLENDNNKEIVDHKDIDDFHESSFKYHAVPLDKQMTLDENGMPFSLQELMDLKELREEFDVDD